MHIRILGLIFSVFFLTSCSSSQDSAEPTIDATLDGESLSISDVHARYLPNQKAAEVTAKLSDGRHLIFRYGSYIPYEGSDVAFMLGYVKITDADGSNAFTTLYDMPRRFSYLYHSDPLQYDISQRINIDFTGKLFADENNPNSPFHYLQFRMIASYDETDDAADLVYYGFYLNPWYSVKKKQLNAPGQPISLVYNSDNNKQFRLFFEAIPTVGYYNIDANSPYRVEYSEFDGLQYLPTTTTSGLMQITEVGPNFVKGVFSVSGMLNGTTSFNYSNGSFSCTYN
jgi:hypothetical protein